MPGTGGQAPVPGMAGGAEESKKGQIPRSFGAGPYERSEFKTGPGLAFVGLIPFISFT